MAVTRRLLKSLGFDDAAYVQKIKAASYRLDAHALAEQLLGFGICIQPPPAAVIALQDQSSALSEKQAGLDVKAPNRHQRQTRSPP